ncbi:hypothetical protein MNBD_NITROSPIRAE02-25 [hydrothermal vent metagenome]|uniref:Response regulatory domain-containing protein n=1 Tax=hydrothermal vent metagenome TaxID=652676 RepID=A0A3B1CRS9_9ZZZZ
MDKKEFKILIVDDDEIARDVVVSLLAREGFSVHSACDGFEGIRALKLELYSLIITDLRMPGADGFEVLKAACNLNPKAAVVILTAYGTLDNAIEAIKFGAYDYITKPFKLQEIIIVVENALKRAELIGENEELRLHLRNTYRDLEMINTVKKNAAPDVIVNFLERLARLRQMDIISEGDVEILKEKLLSGAVNATSSDSR